MRTGRNSFAHRNLSLISLGLNLDTAKLFSLYEAKRPFYFSLHLSKRISVLSQILWPLTYGLYIYINAKFYKHLPSNAIVNLIIMFFNSLLNFFFFFFVVFFFVFSFFFCLVFCFWKFGLKMLSIRNVVGWIAKRTGELVEEIRVFNKFKPFTIPIANLAFWVFASRKSQNGSTSIPSTDIEEKINFWANENFFHQNHLQWGGNFIPTELTGTYI